MSFYHKRTRLDTRSILAMFSALTTFLTIVMMFVFPIPKQNEEILKLLLPIYFTGTAIACFGYYFGSSKGQEQEKANTQTIAITTPTVTDTNDTTNAGS